VTGLQDERPWLLLAAALVIFALLRPSGGALHRALIPLAPALLAAGLTRWSSRSATVALSPLSAGLDPLVLAVGVEFGLVLEARYREERELGIAPEVAARLTMRAVGTPSRCRPARSVWASSSWSPVMCRSCASSGSSPPSSSRCPSWPRSCSCRASASRSTRHAARGRDSPLAACIERRPIPREV